MDVLEIPTSSKHHILATVLNSCKLKTTQNSGGKEELKSNNSEFQKCLYQFYGLI